VCCPLCCEASRRERAAARSQRYRAAPARGRGGSASAPLRRARSSSTAVVNSQLGQSCSTTATNRSAALVVSANRAKSDRVMVRKVGEAAILHRRTNGRLETSMTLTRITVDPNKMGGVPCIRGLRIPVATVLGMIADGMTEAEILAAYPDLEGDDLAEALRYAAEAVREFELSLTIP